MGTRLGVSFLVMLSFLLVVAVSVSALPYGAVAQWDFNETSSPFVDNWNGYNMVWQGTLSYNATYPDFNISGSGAPNSSYGIANGNGNVEDIFFNESLQANTSSITLQTWVKQDSNSNGGYFIIDNLLRTGFRFDNSNAEVRAYGNSASGIFSVTNDVWYFIGLKCEAGDCWYYYGDEVSGSLVNSSITPGSSTMGAQLYVNGRTSTSFGLRGKVDRTQVFNVSLSWADIKNYYNYGYEVPGAAPPPFVNGTGTELDPYELWRCSDIHNMTWNESAHYEVMNDLDCENVTDTYNTGVNFAGTLYGRNNTIKNYYINQTLAGNNVFCSLFESNEGYIENLIINNFSITCYHSVNFAWTQWGSIFGGLFNPTYKEVAIKNSYINARFENAFFGVRQTGIAFNLTANDTYVYNSVIDPITSSLLSSWFRSSYATDITGSTEVRNSWADVSLSSPGNENGNCFVGKNTGTMINNYYNNETCNDSLHTSYGATGIASNMFTDATNTIWENYSLDKWFFENGNYPILAWEYEEQPRPTITSPGSDLNISYNDLTIYYTVSDTDSSSVDCDLYLDGSVNQSDLSISPGSNESFIMLDLAEGSHEYYLECTDGLNTRLSGVYSVSVDSLPPVILSLNPGALNSSMLNYTFTAKGNITDLNYLSSNYSLFYPNGSLLWYSPNSTWNKTLDVTPLPGLYSLEISALDLFNNSARLDISFFINDTVPPVCYGFSDASVYEDTAYSWAGSCIDERMIYSFNISCSGQSNYNYSEIDINQSIYMFTGSETFSNGSSLCSWEACDGHTAQKLHKDKWYIRDNKDNTLETEFRGKKNKIKTDDPSDFTYEILEDRISFNITFKNKKETSYIIYYETSGLSSYIPDQNYQGWIIDYKAKTWFDLNSPDNDFSVDVRPWNKTAWRIEIIPNEERNSRNSNTDTYEFNSIGELNCISGIQNFTSSYRAEPPYTEIDEVREFNSVQQALFYIFLYLVWFAFLILTFIMKGRSGNTIQLFNLLQVFLGVIIGAKFLAFSTAFGLITIVAAAVVFIFKAVESF